MLGPVERNLKIIREALGVAISARNGAVRLSGDDASVNQAAEVIHELAQAAKKRKPMGKVELLEHIHRLAARADDHPEGVPGRWATSDMAMDVYARGQRVSPKTVGQKRYIQAILEHDLVFCSGPAGTGKTYLAVAAAVSMLKRSTVRKLILARPAVEAGEKLGFLPGDMQAKVNPYLRPLLDALHDMMPFDQVQRFMHSDLIEVVPLAFMRGRTLNDAAIILDEAQNTTRSQMLMFLTRMGHGSKMIVTGDTSQVDLEIGTESGLIDAARRLGRVPGVGFVTLDRQDIVRHSLVERIVHAYGQDDPAG
ncbi:PhoH family protein [Planctomycetales bacterium ZRK34]|nr:PhoH family protein [Planctomycetales bacterium ZRK34]